MHGEETSVVISDLGVTYIPPTPNLGVNFSQKSHSASSGNCGADIPSGSSRDVANRLPSPN